MGVYADQVRPRLLDAALRGSQVDTVRARVCAGLSGDVVEIGYGSGLNQPHYPPRVSGVWAVEPSQTALRIAAPRQRASSTPVVRAGDDAHRLRLPDGRFRAALSTWVLCGLADPVAALRELARVLEPGGVLHFVEHGLAPDERVVRWQRRGNALNRRLAGCVLDNDVVGLLERGGFEVLALERYYQGAPKAAGSMYEGRARAVRA